MGACIVSQMHQSHGQCLTIGSSGSHHFALNVTIKKQVAMMFVLHTQQVQQCYRNI